MRYRCLDFRGKKIFFFKNQAVSEVQILTGLHHLRQITTFLGVSRLLIALFLSALTRKLCKFRGNAFKVKCCKLKVKANRFGKLIDAFHIMKLGFSRSLSKVLQKLISEVFKRNNRYRIAFEVNFSAEYQHYTSYCVLITCVKEETFSATC